MSHTQNLSSNTQKNISVLTKEEADRYPELLQKCDKEDNKALEMKQIECQQRLITERMIRLELQKNQLQHILDVLESLDSDDDDDDDEDDDDDDAADQNI